MIARTIIVLFVISMCICIVSCQKLEDVHQTEQTLEKLAIEFRDAIPTEFGRLVGVTSNGEFGNWAQLWFEKPDTTIIVVYVNFIDGNINPNVLVIPRK
ncbi:MAG: hypothetical protein JSV33_13105 [bacterium]|nr:MAG: hypothetical protein JSV33_13105 [bacterium]